VILCGCVIRHQDGWGTVLLDVIIVLFCFVLRRSANAKLPDISNQQCVHYSTGDDKSNIKSNNNPNDINEDVYNHLGDVLRNHTKSPEATGNIYGSVGQS
jgi:hypothetical protein